MSLAIRRALILLVIVGVAWWLQTAVPDERAGGEASEGAVQQHDVRSHDPAREPDRDTLPPFLPPEAAPVLAAIARGGPFEYRQDGTVFQNRERLLPRQPRGHYREYTVETPGSDDRGPRRIVTGGDPPTEFWYTDDHYRSFQRFEFDAGSAQ
ncbi:MAG: ribonuclease domain-containing protein [Silanimonas sp.]